MICVLLASLGEAERCPRRGLPVEAALPDAPMR
jgi:hypothetical protein